MNVLLIIGLLILYAIFEFINGIFFNWKLYLLSEKKYTAAGFFSAISTVLLLSAAVIAVAYSYGDDGSNIIWWFIPLTALFMGAGNFLAAISVPKIRAKIALKSDAKKLKKDQKDQGS